MRSDENVETTFELILTLVPTHHHALVLQNIPDCSKYTFIFSDISYKYVVT